MSPRARQNATTHEPATGESRSLEAQIEELAGAFADLRLEVRAWRADQARGRSVSEHDEVLGVLVAELVGDAAFSAADVMARAIDHSELRYALTLAGAFNGKRLGHLLSRLEARRGSSDGIHFIRIGADRDGVVWRVLRD